MKKEFVSFFGTWGEYFYRFMVGLGVEIILAVLYISLGIAFLAVGLQLPPEVTAEAVSRHGGMTLFLLATSVAVVVQMVKFTIWLIQENKEDQPPAQPAPPAAPAKEAV